MLETWKNDLRFAIRSLGRRPGFATVPVLTLTLGIGAHTAIFSVVHGTVLRALPLPDADQLVASTLAQHSPARDPTLHRTHVRISLCAQLSEIAQS